MTDTSASLDSPLAEIPDREWRALVKRGDARGWVGIDEVMRALENVELSADLIAAVRSELAQRQIFLDEDDHALDAVAAPQQAPVDGDDVQARLAARRRRRSEVLGGEGGSTEDPVRMYRQFDPIPLTSWELGFTRQWPRPGISARIQHRCTGSSTLLH